MIKFVYFDLGGVVVKDFSGTNKWSELVNDLGIKKDEIDEFDKWFDGIEPDICRGKEIDSYINILREKYNLKLPEDYSFLRDFVNRFERNETIWPIINDFKNHFRIGLLTNMYPRMFDEIEKRNLMPNIDFEIVIDSSVVKYQKPDKEIYEIAEQRANVNPDEILFIENSRKNILAAEERGWNTFFYNSGDITNSNNSLLELLQNI